MQENTNMIWPLASNYNLLPLCCYDMYSTWQCARTLFFAMNEFPHLPWHLLEELAAKCQYSIFALGVETTRLSQQFSECKEQWPRLAKYICHTQHCFRPPQNPRCQNGSSQGNNKKSQKPIISLGPIPAARCLFSNFRTWCISGSVVFQALDPQQNLTRLQRRSLLSGLLGGRKARSTRPLHKQ